MKAAKKVVFGAVHDIIGVEKVSFPLQGYGVQLAPVVEMIVREQRLHQVQSAKVYLNIKIDGRPFWGNYCTHLDVCTCTLLTNSKCTCNTC